MPENTPERQAYFAKWREENREQLRANARQYYQDNRDSILAKSRAKKGKAIAKEKREPGDRPCFDAHGGSVNEYQYDHYQTNYDLYRTHKETHPCVLCGEGDPGSLHFHHRDPTVKEGLISNLLRGRTDRLIAEMEKCVMLCHGCHKQVHADARRHARRARHEAEMTYLRDLFQ